MSAATSDEFDDIRADLVIDEDECDTYVPRLSDLRWLWATPIAGLNTLDRFGHLSYIDGSTMNAILDSESFVAELGDTIQGALAEGIKTLALSAFRATTSRQQLVAGQNYHASLAAAETTQHDDTCFDGNGPSLGRRKFLSARQKETRAPGRYFADSVDVKRRQQTGWATLLDSVK